MTRSRSNSPGFGQEWDGQHSNGRAASVAPSGLMRQIISDHTGPTQDDCKSMDAHTPAPVVPFSSSKDKEVWMASHDEELEDAAGQFLDKLIDQKAQNSELHFQTVAESVAAGVETDVSASIGRQENYGVLVGAAPLGVNFRPLKKLRMQTPRLGLKLSARKVAKNGSSKAPDPIRVPTLPRTLIGATAYREEQIMDGVVGMVPKSPAAASGLMTQGTGKLADASTEDYGHEDANGDLPGSTPASEAHTASKPNTAADQASQVRKEKQVCLRSYLRP